MMPGISKQFIFVLTIALAGIWAAPQATRAQDAAPGFQLVSPDPVTPQEAEAYFDALRDAQEAGDVQVPPAGAAATQVVPDIAELARALRDNIDLIYQYVHNEIELTPTYGLAKGPLGTLLDGSGNPFDQTNLFIKLAEAAGYEARFVYGTLELTESELNAWLGTEGGIGVGGNVLVQGGIPAEGVTPTLIEFSHAWAQVQIGEPGTHSTPRSRRMR